MKKIFKTLAIVAVAALGFACQNEIDEQVNGNEGEKVTVEVVGSVADLTRSTFGKINTTDKKVPSTWSGNEQVGFSALASLDKTAENEGSMVAATNAETGATASFSVEFDAIDEGNTVFAVSPYNSTKDYSKPGFSGITTQYQEFYVTIPATQTPLANSVEEGVHLMVGEATYEGGAMTMTFEHVAAYAKMNITNFVGNGVKEIAVTFPDYAFGQGLYYVYADEDKGKILFPSKTEKLAATVTINPENVSNVANGVWFTVAPVGALEGAMTVVVTDNDDKTYTKELATAGKLAFIKGQVSEFTVNMSGIAADGEKDYCGNYNIVAKRSSGNFFYMTSDLGTASTKRFQIVDTGANVIGDVAENADYVWVVEKSGDNYKIKTNDGQYITWSSGSGNSANLASTGKEMTIKANGNAVNIRLVDTPARYLSLNNNSSSNYFAFYEGTQVNDLYLIPYTGTVVVKEATTIELDAYEGTVDIKEGTEAASDKFIEPNAIVVDASGDPVEGAKPTYTSNNADVATVNAENGNVTFTGGTGSVTITISYAGDDNYKGCSAEYTIKVTNSTAGGGQGESYSYSVTSGVWSAWNKGVACGAITWTPAKVTADASATVGNKDGSGRGQQFGAATSGKKLTSMTMTGTGYEGGIKSVDVSACAKSGNTVTINVTVGGVAMTSTKNSYTISGSDSSSVVTAEFTSETPLTGDIVITYTLKTKGAVYVSGFAVNN